MRTLGENIKQLRQKHGMSQIALATKLNITKQCVSNWENDYVDPSIEMLIKLSDLFLVSTDYLLGRTKNNYIDISFLTDEQAAHIRMLIADLKIH